MTDDYMSVDEFVEFFIGLFQTREEGEQALSEGRKWVQETFYD